MFLDHGVPSEVRTNIIGCLHSMGASLSSLAAVSRGWQEDVEALNFARITLTPSCLSSPILHRKRHLIQHIWFRIEVNSYDSAACKPKYWSVSAMDEADERLIVDAIESLFWTLGKWERHDDLELDISVYSPSDSQYWFKYISYDPDHQPGETSTPMWSGQPNVSAPFHDPGHGWVDGRQEAAPGALAIEKVFSEIMSEGPFENDKKETGWWMSLPSVPAVTSVRFRRQTRRRWKPQALAQMLAHFPNLQEVWWEPWREWSLMSKRTDEHNRSFIESLMSRVDLRKVVIFEDFNEQYPLRYIEDDDFFSQRRNLDPAVSLALAESSLDLEELSASFMVDAGLFFQARQECWTWAFLTSLTMTSLDFLNVQSSASQASVMLRTAAGAAMNMPNLETLEIWNGRRGVAMLFRYQAVKTGKRQRTAVITKRGTSPLPLGPRTTRAWIEVADRHGCAKIITKTSILDPDTIKSHGDAIRQLGLVTQVVRPTSLEQILQEHRVRNGKAFIPEERAGFMIIKSSAVSMSEDR